MVCGCRRRHGVHRQLGYVSCRRDDVGRWLLRGDFGERFDGLRDDAVVLVA